MFRFRVLARGAILCCLLSTAGLLAGQAQVAQAAASATTNLNTADSRAAIQAVLDAQRTAWNHHDLDAFMAGYWNSPNLTFYGAKETSGWQAMLQRYRDAYQSEGKAMGNLDFSDLRIEVLCSDAAFVRGKWRLVMPDQKQPHGLFTLVFRKFPEGWKIIHDHTSAATD